MNNDRYYLKADWQSEWTEVTKEQFIAAEQAAGFRSKFGQHHLATSGFSGNGMSGRIDSNTIEPPETANRYQEQDSELKTSLTVNKSQISTGECTLSDCFCHEAQRPTFDRKWQQAPQSMKRTTEYETAAYWFEIGRQTERSAVVELVSTDLHELLRLVKERL